MVGINLNKRLTPSKKKMESLKINVECTDVDLSQIQHITNYLRNTYDWPEEKLQVIAQSVNTQMLQYGLSEEDAIKMSLASLEECAVAEEVNYIAEDIEHGIDKLFIYNDLDNTFGFLSW